MSTEGELLREAVGGNNRPSVTLNENDDTEVRWRVNEYDSVQNATQIISATFVMDQITDNIEVYVYDCQTETIVAERVYETIEQAAVEIKEMINYFHEDLALGG